MGENSETRPKLSAILLTNRPRSRDWAASAAPTWTPRAGALPSISLCPHRDGLVAERQILLDAINVGWSEQRCLPQRAAAFGILVLKQVAFSGTTEHNFASSGYLETLGY